MIGFLLSVGRDRQWVVWERGDDAEKGAYVLKHANPKGHSRMILDAGWAPLLSQGKYVFLTAGRDKSVKIWCIRDESADRVELLTSISTSSPVTAVACCPTLHKGQVLFAFGTESGEVSIGVLKEEGGAVAAPIASDAGSKEALSSQSNGASGDLNQTHNGSAPVTGNDSMLKNSASPAKDDTSTPYPPPAATSTETTTTSTTTASDPLPPPTAPQPTNLSTPAPQPKKTYTTTVFPISTQISPSKTINQIAWRPRTTENEDGQEWSEEQLQVAVASDDTAVRVYNVRF